MLNPFFPGFFQWLRFEKRYSPHTLTSYNNDLAGFAMYLIDEYPTLQDINELNHYQIRSWLALLKDQDQLSAATLNRKISTLNSFFKYLMRQGILQKNPASQVRSLKKPERLPVYLKEAETKNLLEEESFGEGFKGFTDRLICELLYNTGMRRQELIDLKENDVEWSLRQLRVLGKGNKERLIPLNDAVLDTLRDYLAAKDKMPDADRSRLIVLGNGRALYPGYVYRTASNYLGKVSSLKKRSPHVMRHTFATHLLNNGANIQAIKDLLGHSSLAATQVYTHNNITQLQEIHKRAHPREQND
jgi:integrase/recombinase XerC